MFITIFLLKVRLLSRVQLLATPWTADHQAPPPMGFSRQEYWSGVPFPSPSYYCCLTPTSAIFPLGHRSSCLTLGAVLTQLTCFTYVS